MPHSNPMVREMMKPENVLAALKKARLSELEKEEKKEKKRVREEEEEEEVVVELKKVKKEKVVRTFFSRSKDADMKLLSNFEGGELEYKKGVKAQSVESAFQAEKYLCLVEGPNDALYRSVLSMDAKAAKTAGGKGAMKKHKVQLDVAKWNNCSFALMEQLVDAKVKSNPKVAEVLTKCGKEGVFLQHISARNSDKIWAGEANGLGRIYMNHPIYLDAEAANNF